MTDKEYCELSKVLLKAARILEDDIAIRPKKRAIANLRVSAALAEWLENKADVLDEHYKAWLAEEQRYIHSRINQLGGATKVAEDHYTYALAVAREVIYLDEQRHVKAVERKNPIREIFRGSRFRKSKADQS